jgi:hypothetical protein
LDTKTHSLIVYAYKNSTYQKTLRYDLIRSTDFPKIPIGNSKIKITRTVTSVIPATNKITENGITTHKLSTDDVKGGIYVPHIKYNYKFY